MEEGKKDKPRCFVIMPIGNEREEPERYRKWKKIYDDIVKPPIQKAGLECIRADEITDPASINRDIIEHLFKADIVIADLTEKNPNVFYELGVRHALQNSKGVLIAQSTKELPFDLQSYRVLEYATDYSEAMEFQQNLVKAVEAKLSSSRPDNPVKDFLPLEATPPDALQEQVRETAEILTDRLKEIAALSSESMPKESVSQPKTDAPAEGTEPPLEVQQEFSRLMQQQHIVMEYHNRAAILLQKYVTEKREGKDPNTEALQQAELFALMGLCHCSNLQAVAGTLYNLARAQALQGKREALTATFSLFLEIPMPANLMEPIAGEREPDFHLIKDMPELQRLKRHYEQLLSTQSSVPRITSVQYGFLCNNEVKARDTIAAGGEADPIFFRFQNKSIQRLYNLHFEIKFLRRLALSGSSSALQMIQHTVHGRSQEYYLIGYTLSIGPEGCIDSRVELNLRELPPGEYPIEISLSSPEYALQSKTLHLKVVEGKIRYRTHLENIGWTKHVADGLTSGTTGQHKQMEAIQITCREGGVRYWAHLLGTGWDGPYKDGEVCGVIGENRHIEAIRIEMMVYLR